MARNINQKWPATPRQPDTSWQRDAACAGHDPELWSGSGCRHHPNPEALATCAGCPVRAACLDYALDQRIHQGIWGGLTPEQRTTYRRASNRRKEAS